MRRYGLLVLLEQGVFSAAGFIVTVVVLRESDVRSVAAFGLAYQIALGGLALLSEALVTPLLLAARAEARSVMDVVERPLCAVASLLLAAGASLGAIRIVPQYVTIAVLVLAVIASGLAYSAKRAIAYGQRDVIGALSSGLVRVSVTVIGLGLAVDGSVSASAALSVVALGFLVPMLRLRLLRPASGGRGRPRLDMFAQAWAWPLLTGLRVLGFGVVPLALLTQLHGPQSAAVVVTAGAVIAPVQLLSAAAGNVILPAARESGLRQAVESRISLLKLLALVLGLLAVLLLVLPAWARLTLGDASELVGHPLPLSLLAVLVVTSSILSLHYRLASTPVPACLAVGIATISAAAAAIADQPLASLILPYAIFCLIAVVAAGKGR